ncbi:hypothetical protein AGLY_001657 [Aphis glycines]|uniref:Reverse transcriptase domain-containing protein n=1 Tax=Aphis glycines TaxID=307491 RepID=A0A6G0U4C3_APHGL|nr:hypothetical protein AGLY_001657 [Aphis glycines]
MYICIALLLFFDLLQYNIYISIFYNVARISLIDEMIKFGASQASVSMTKNYLLDRTASLSGFYSEPALWNIVVNGILKNFQNKHVYSVAYVDDIAALSSRFGLTFSATKSVRLMQKDELEHGFTIEFREDRIRTIDKIKYLGIIIDQDMKFHTQPEAIAQKSTLDMRAQNNIWGVYMDEGVRQDDMNLRTKLYDHRGHLLILSGAYRTTSTNILQVVRGQLPLDLQILWEGIRQVTNTVIYDQRRLGELREMILDAWQKR